MVRLLWCDSRVGSPQNQREEKLLFEIEQELILKPNAASAAKYLTESYLINWIVIVSGKNARDYLKNAFLGKPRTRAVIIYCANTSYHEGLKLEYPDLVKLVTNNFTKVLDAIKDFKKQEEEEEEKEKEAEKRNSQKRRSPSPRRNPPGWPFNSPVTGGTSKNGNFPYTGTPPSTQNTPQPLSPHPNPISVSRPKGPPHNPSEYEHLKKELEERFARVVVKCVQYYEERDKLEKSLVSETLLNELVMLNKKDERKITENFRNLKNDLLRSLIYEYSTNEIYPTFNLTFALSEYEKVENVIGVGYALLESKKNQLYYQGEYPIYRGSTHKNPDFYNTLLETKKTGYFTCFSSCSQDRNVSEEFTENKGTLYVITLSKESPHLHINLPSDWTAYPSEKEILLYPYFAFKVVRFEQNPLGRDIVHLIQDVDAPALSFNITHMKSFWVSKFPQLTRQYPQIFRPEDFHEDSIPHKRPRLEEPLRCSICSRLISNYQKHQVDKLTYYHTTELQTMSNASAYERRPLIGVGHSSLIVCGECLKPRSMDFNKLENISDEETQRPMVMEISSSVYDGNKSTRSMNLSQEPSQLAAELVTYLHKLKDSSSSPYTPSPSSSPYSSFPFYSYSSSSTTFSFTSSTSTSTSTSTSVPSASIFSSSYTLPSFHLPSSTIQASTSVPSASFFSSSSSSSSSTSSFNPFSLTSNLFSTPK